MRFPFSFLAPIVGACIFAGAAEAAALDPKFVTTACSNDWLQIYYQDPNSSSTSAVLLSEVRKNSPLACRRERVTANEVLAEATKAGVKVDVDYQTNTLNPAAKASSDSESQKRLNQAKAFQCEYVNSPLQPARVATISNCGQSVLIAGVVCKDELGGSISTVVACQNRKGKSATDCFNEVFSKPADGIAVRTKEVSVGGESDQSGTEAK